MSFFTLTIGLLISFTSFYFTSTSDLEHLFTTPRPISSWSIFIHNFKILLLYRIPILGFINYSFSFIIVFSTLGLSFSYQGIIETIRQLPHLPFEILALSITASLSISRWKNLKYEIDAICVGIVLLSVASILEFYQQGVILCYTIFFLCLLYLRYKHKAK